MKHWHCSWGCEKTNGILDEKTGVVFCGRCWWSFHTRTECYLCTKTDPECQYGTDQMNFRFLPDEDIQEKSIQEKSQEKSIQEKITPGGS